MNDACTDILEGERQMTNVKAGLVAGVIAGLVVGQLVDAQPAPTKPAQPAAPAQAMPQTPDAVFKDIEATVGFVPQFFRAVSDSQLPSFWDSFKTFQMNPNTALDGKTKELIGLAVSAQIPCTYCIYFHTEAAKANGASDQQIREAIGMAAMTRMASTVINGGQVNDAQFKKDVQRMMKEASKKPPTAASR